MFSKILVGYDGTPHSETAFRVALDLARKYKAELHAAAVAHLPDYPAVIDEVQGALSQAEEYYGRALAGIEMEARQARVSLKTHLLKGHAAQAILEMSEREGFDLIIIGARPLSTVQRYLLGSVSAAIMRYSSCPVLVVKASPRSGQ